MKEAESVPGSEENVYLPKSSFVLVTVWALVEALVLTSASLMPLDNDASELYSALSQPFLLSGLGASITMLLAWLVFGAWWKSTASSLEVAARWLIAGLVVFVCGVIVATPFRGSSSSLAAYFAMVTGGLVLLMMYRNYFDYRLIHVSQVDGMMFKKSSVSIIGLLGLTLGLAMSLAICRYLAGGIDEQLIFTAIVGVLVGINWIVTSLWMLRRPVMVVAVIGVLVAEFVLLVAMVGMDHNREWADRAKVFAILFGLQLHLTLFLLSMRADEFRFARPQFVGRESTNDVIAEF